MKAGTSCPECGCPDIKKLFSGRYRCSNCRHSWKPPIAPGTKCGNCGELEGVEMEPSRTCYPWNGEGKSPNADLALCRECAVDHHDHWDEMWADYYHGLL